MNFLAVIAAGMMVLCVLLIATSFVTGKERALKLTITALLLCATVAILSWIRALV